MERANVAIFLTAVGLIGIAPILLAAVAIARRRGERRGADPERPGRPLLVVGSVTALLLVGGGTLAWRYSTTGADPGIPTGMTGMAGMTGMPGLGAPSTTDVGGQTGMPSQIAGHPLTSYLDGPEAIANVTQLHGSAFVPTEAEVATYGEGAITIWRSAAPDEAAASDQVTRMAERIAEGGSPFEPPRADGPSGVYATFGMGQDHFFFARGTSVWWVAAEPSIASAALADTLAVST